MNCTYNTSITTSDPTDVLLHPKFLSRSASAPEMQSNNPLVQQLAIYARRSSFINTSNVVTPPTANSILTSSSIALLNNIQSSAIPNVSLVADFLHRLTKMLRDDGNEQFIEWSSDGKLHIHNPTKLASDILPKYYRHSKYSSFQRQLNYFGFRKILGKGKMSPCVYSNDYTTNDVFSILSLKRKQSFASNKSMNSLKKANKSLDKSTTNAPLLKKKHDFSTVTKRTPQDDLDMHNFEFPLVQQVQQTPFTLNHQYSFNVADSKGSSSLTPGQNTVQDSSNIELKHPINNIVVNNPLQSSNNRCVSTSPVTDQATNDFSDIMFHMPMPLTNESSYSFAPSNVVSQPNIVQVPNNNMQSFSFHHTINHDTDTSLFINDLDANNAFNLSSKEFNDILHSLATTSYDDDFDFDNDSSDAMPDLFSIDNSENTASTASTNIDSMCFDQKQEDNFFLEPHSSIIG